MKNITILRGRDEYLAACEYLSEIGCVSEDKSYSEEEVIALAKGLRGMCEKCGKYESEFASLLCKKCLQTFVREHKERGALA